MTQPERMQPTPPTVVVTCQEHLGRHEPADDCVTPYVASDPGPAAEPTWEDVWAAIGREVWKLAPQDHQDSGHRDLTFLVCWQNVMEAVDKGIASCYPEESKP